MVDDAVRRVLRGFMKVGRFDHPYGEKVAWSSIKSDVIGGPKHSKIRDDAARQTAVLLRNLGNTLPLKADKQKTIAVVGPSSNTGYGLMPDYFGDEVCPKGSFDCVPTFYTAIKSLHTGPTIVYQGVSETSTDNQNNCLLYTSPSPRDQRGSRMPSSA